MEGILSQRMVQWNRIASYRSIHRLTFEEIAWLEGITPQHVALLHVMGKFHRKLVCEEYTPVTSTDPDGVELAWACFEKELEMRGLRLPLPTKAPKVEIPKKGKGSYKRKPKNPRCGTFARSTQYRLTKIIPSDPLSP